ncbi:MULTISPECIES: ABC transporter ATP-binding protein [unclassified Rhizobium]|uniref:ABC transporter ATP-binding protein n=1 Tax=unclassified Rhizobium TaxID=2613769 RepID=UPI0037FC1289
MIAAATDTAVHVQGLVRRFGSLSAARDINLDIARGEIFGLVGPDGAGKTTIMRVLAGVLRPDAGTVTVEGVDVVASPELAKSLISYMPQRFGLYEDLTVAENIFFYGELFAVPRAIRRERTGALLEAAGLRGFERRLAGQLSGGMKQKLGLICALIHTPKVLLLDEPTTGVDPVSRRDFWAILYGLREEGVTIILSTAYMDEAERCSRLALVNAGEIHHCDTPTKLKEAMPGALLAVVADNPRAARNALMDAPGVLGLLLMGDRINVRVDDAGTREPELRKRLATHAISVSAITPVEPAIEDVFVALLGKEQHDG